MGGTVIRPPVERRCHRCGKDIGALESVGRRDICLHCGTDLHCCLNCSLYEPTSHNQCREPQSERQVDKQVGNFCEYFSFHTRSAGRAGAPGGEDARARLANLFTKKA